MNKKDRTNFMKSCRPVLKQLVSLEKKFGPDIARYSMRRFLDQKRNEETRVKEIKKLENELDELRNKRL